MDMLRNITTASAAASNPLLKSLLGPNASEAEYQELAKEAENVWKMMDDLADHDPEGYQSFVRDAAKAAREEVEKGRDPHVEGISPALVLEAQAHEPRQPAAGAGAGATPALTRVIAGGQAVARVHIWAATDASGVGPATAGGAAVSPQQCQWSGLVVPLAEYKPATTRPGPLPVHHFHIACHASAVRLCLAGQPGGFPAALLEAVSQFVEGEYRLELSRTLRTLQVHREAVSETELQALLKRQEDAQRATATPGEEAAEAQSQLPKGLLEELRTLGTGPTRPSPAAAAVTSASPQRSATPKKALIEELD